MIKVSEEDRENLRADLSRFNKLLNRRPDDEIKMSMVIRAAIRDFHESIQQGKAPKWLSDYPMVRQK